MLPGLNVPVENDLRVPHRGDEQVQRGAKHRCRCRGRSVGVRIRRRLELQRPRRGARNRVRPEGGGVLVREHVDSFRRRCSGRPGAIRRARALAGTAAPRSRGRPAQRVATSATSRDDLRGSRTLHGGDSPQSGRCRERRTPATWKIAAAPPDKAIAKCTNSLRRGAVHAVWRRQTPAACRSSRPRRSMSASACRPMASGHCSMRLPKLTPAAGGSSRLGNG